MELKGRAAIVTGAATGVGRATALALARRGCSVLVNYSRSRRDAERTAAEASGLGVEAFAFQADVSDDDACRAMVEAAVTRFGRLDLLVNNAATTVIVPHGDLEAVRDEHWERLLRVNLIGAFQCARAARPHLEAQGGEIVNVSSVAGIAGIGSSIPYCVSKAGLNLLTVMLARALAPHVRVNAVAPGFIEGRWFREALGAEGYERLRETMQRNAPLKRVCTPDDVAQAILNLVTGPDLVTGQILAVDGGMLLAR